MISFGYSVMLCWVLDEKSPFLLHQWEEEEGCYITLQGLMLLAFSLTFLVCALALFLALASTFLLAVALFLSTTLFLVFAAAGLCLTFSLLALATALFLLRAGFIIATVSILVALFLL